MNVILFVIDGLGMWSDKHSSTYQVLEDHFHLNPNFNFPVLCELGLIKAKEGKGNLLMQKSIGVGSLEGHREMFNYVSLDEYTIFPKGIPTNILKKVESEYSFTCLGNIQGRGKQIISQYWEQHRLKKSPIIYSGVDYTISMAFEKGTIDTHISYNFAKTLMMCLRDNGTPIRKFIVREFLNSPDNKVSEKELFYPIDFNNKVRKLRFKSIFINNKIQDIFEFQDAIVTKSDCDEECFMQFFDFYFNAKKSLIFLNLGDFDYNAHNGNIDACLKALEKIDLLLSKVRQELKDSDYLIITSDHGVSYENSSLLFSHLKECTLFLVSNRKEIYYHPGIASGHGLVFDTLQAISDNRELSNLAFKEYITS